MSNFVCPNCINDKALQKVISENASSQYCDYCETESEHMNTAPLNIITDHMIQCFYQEYCDPADVLPYESREGGYQGPVYDCFEILEKIDFDVEDNTLRNDIISNISDYYWTDLNFLSLNPVERMIHGWDDFSNFVKHKRRYTFWTIDDKSSEEEYDHDNIPVGSMLDLVADSILNAELIHQLNLNTKLWRVRVHKSNIVLDKPSDFSAPPLDCSLQPNRMSPAGISMFYGSENFETAVKETLDTTRAKGKLVTGGYFNPYRTLNILDLYNLPESPSFFDLDSTDLRYALRFLRSFSKSLSNPIKRDGKEHIDYVPTQAFSEYVRYRLKDKTGCPIDGIRYQSSKCKKACYVIFCEHEQCFKQQDRYRPKQILHFCKSSLKSIDAENPNSH